MGLRAKALIAMAVLCTVVLAAGLAGTISVAHGFDRAERETLTEHLVAVEALVDRTAETIAASARDYAFWTESLRFVEGRYADYPAEQIGNPVTTLGSLGLDALIYVDAAHAIVFEAYVVDDQPTDIPDDLAAWAQAADFPELGTSATAVTTIDGQPALAAIAGITNNDETVEPAGILIMAGLIDDALLNELSSASPATLSLGPPGTTAELRFADEDTAVGGVNLHDLDGSTTAVLQATLDRPVASAARDSLETLVVALAGGFALAIFGFGYWLTRNVTRRIATLDEQVDHLRNHGDGTLAVTGGDEIARLADNARGLLDEVAELHHRRAEARHGTMVQHSSDIVVLCEADGLVRYATPALEHTLAVDPVTAVGASIDDVLKVDDALALAANLARLASGSPAHAVTFAADARTAAGEIRHLEIVGTNHLETKDVNALVLTMRDQTERRQIEDDLRRQAVTDALTGLANRTLFQDRVTHALARQQRHASGRTAVLFLDLDDFKTLNDGLGHAAGDAVLRHAAGVIAGCLRPSDTAARLGGDEFACLLEAVGDEADVIGIVDRIHAALADPIAVEDHTVRATASIGIAFADDPATDVDALLRNADTAMYIAKASGKARHTMFSSEMHTDAVRRLKLKNALADAVATNQFRLVYQPLVDLETGATLGAEALLRWNHPTRGEIGPYEFIPLAEETGLIVPIGRWVLHEACQRAARWQRTAPYPHYVSVNVSARQLEDDRIIDDVAQAIASSNLPPELLQLELTESLFIANRVSIAGTLRELKKLGITLAVDDFGTGHASLAYLRDFPIDVLKIDRSFIQAIEEDTGTDEFLQGVLTLAQSLRLRTLAEGIEHEYERDQLVAADCELGQGYFFARPLEADDFEARLVATGNVPVGDADTHA